jgi:hypothetical protein
MQASRAIWLLFLDTNTSLEQFFTDINIPFDCQFLVAQPQRDHVVVLTELYRVSPTLPMQTYRFGNWTAGGGLTWPSQGLYRRRNNLQGHIMNVIYNNVRGKFRYEELYFDTVNKSDLEKLLWGFGYKAKYCKLYNGQKNGN